MMAKDMRVAYLLDFYGDLLTDKQRDSLDFYYNEDLSLGEIGERRLVYTNFVWKLSCLYF